MVSNLFESLLAETSQILNVPLKANANGTSIFAVPNGPRIQLEIDDDETYFAIVAELGQIPIGKYRENLFKDALIANATPPPRVGRFAYSEQSEMFLIFEHLDLKDLTGQKIADVLDPFVKKALKWREAVTNGEVPHIEAETTPAGLPDVSGLFDLLK